MSDKDKEAFDIFYNKHYGFQDLRDAAVEAWQAACEYKQKELEKKLKIAVEALKDITSITRRDGNLNEYDGAEAYISKKALKKINED